MRSLFLLSICCALAIWPVYSALGLPHTALPYAILAFFPLLGVAANRLRSSAKDPKAAVRVGMAVIAGKLAFTMAMLLVVMFLARGPMLKPYTFTFLAFYVLFLAHDTLAGTRHGTQA